MFVDNGCGWDAFYIVMLFAYPVGIYYILVTFYKSLNIKDETIKEYDTGEVRLVYLIPDYIFKIPFALWYVAIFTLFSWIYFSNVSNNSPMGALGYTLSHYFSFPDGLTSIAPKENCSSIRKYWSVSFTVLVSLMLASLPVKYVIEKVRIIISDIGGIGKILGKPTPPAGGGGSSRPDSGEGGSLSTMLSEILGQSKEIKGEITGLRPKNIESNVQKLIFINNKIEQSVERLESLRQDLEKSESERADLELNLIDSQIEYLIERMNLLSSNLEERGLGGSNLEYKKYLIELTEKMLKREGLTIPAIRSLIIEAYRKENIYLDLHSLMVQQFLREYSIWHDKWVKLKRVKNKWK